MKKKVILTSLTVLILLGGCSTNEDEFVTEVDYDKYDTYTNDFDIADSIYKEGDEIILNYRYMTEELDEWGQYNTIYAVDSEEDVRNVTSRNFYSSHTYYDLSNFYHDSNTLVQSLKNEIIVYYDLVATNTSTAEKNYMDEIESAYNFSVGRDCVVVGASDDLVIFKEETKYQVSANSEGLFLSNIFNQDYTKMYYISYESDPNEIHILEYNYNQKNNEYEYNDTYDVISDRDFTSNYEYLTFTTIDNNIYVHGIDREEEQEYHFIEEIDLNTKQIKELYGEVEDSIATFHGYEGTNIGESYVVNDEIHYIMELPRYDGGSYIHSVYNTTTNEYTYDVTFENLKDNEDKQYTFDYHSNEKMYVLEFDLNTYESTVYNMNLEDNSLSIVSEFTLDVEDKSNSKMAITNFEYLPY